MSSNKIRFAVVGCGNIGIKHTEMIFANNSAELVAVADTNLLEKEKMARFNVPFFHSLQDFLKAAMPVDVISIATPNAFHYEQTIQCLESGHNVIVEKPIATTRKAVNELIEIAQRNNKRIFPVMQNRYSPPALWLKHIIEENIPGKIFLVQVNCFWNRDQRYYNEPGKEWRGTKNLDGGTLYTQFSHFIDILYWLFGNITPLQSTLQNFNHQNRVEFEDTGIVTFKLENGAIGTINFTTSVWKTNMESSLTIIGEKGSVKIGGQYMNEIKYCRIKDYTAPDLAESNGCNDYGSYKGSAANHHFLFENVISCLRGEPFSLSTVEEGAAVIGIIEKIYAHR